MATMIPASGISAILTADLSYNPSLHVQTIEIDRTSSAVGGTLIAPATTNYVKWFITKQDFLKRCGIAPGTSVSDFSENIFTFDASGAISEVRNPILKFSNLTYDFTVPTVSPEIQRGSTISTTDSSYVGYVGDLSVNYDRLLFASDGTTPTTASSTTTSWFFDQTEIILGLSWNVNDSSMINVSASSNSLISVTKAYNDAAADFIQIKMAGDAFDPHGQSASSADIVNARIDYASKFQSETTGIIQATISDPTVTLTDVTFTNACQQFINSDVYARAVQNKATFEEAIDAAIELGTFQGIQGVNTIPIVIQTYVANNSVYTDVSRNLTPMVVFDPSYMNANYELPTLSDADGQTVNNGYTGTTHMKSLMENTVRFTFTQHPDSHSIFHTQHGSRQFNEIKYTNNGGISYATVPSTDISYVDEDSYDFLNVIATNPAVDLSFEIKTRGPTEPNGDFSINTIEYAVFTATQIEDASNNSSLPDNVITYSPTVGEPISYSYTFPFEINTWDISSTYQKDGVTYDCTVVFGTNNAVISIPFDDPNAIYVTTDIFTSPNNVIIPFANSVTIGGGNTPTPWTPPTGVTSLTGLSSLPGSYLLVKDNVTRLRYTLTSTDNLHSSVVSDMIHAIYVTPVGGTTTALTLSNHDISINTSNKTIDFNYTALSAVQHDFNLNLKKPDTNPLSTQFTASVSASDVYVFPTLQNTTKASPYDTTQITVGESLTMTSSFSSSLDNLTGTADISDNTTNIAVTSSSISGSQFTYTFTIATDASHQAVLTMELANGISNTYSWTAAGLLSPSDHIYSFPTLISYDGTTLNSFDSGKHLKVDTSSNLILTYSGGDKLHSSTYNEQVSSITYKTGTGGTVTTVPESDVTIDAAAETITLANIVVTAVDNIYFTSSLIAPDSIVNATTIDVMVPSSAVMNNSVYDNSGYVTDTTYMMNFDFHSDWYVDRSLSYSSTAELTQAQNNINTLKWEDVVYSERGEDVTGLFYQSSTGYNGNYMAAYHITDTLDETKLWSHTHSRLTNKWPQTSTGKRYWLTYKYETGSSITVLPEYEFYTYTTKMLTQYKNEYLNWVANTHSLIYHLVLHTPTQANANSWNFNSKVDFEFASYLAFGFRKYNGGSTNGNIYAFFQGITPHEESYATWGDLPTSRQDNLNVFTIIFDQTKTFSPTLNAWKDQCRIFQNGQKISTFYKASDWRSQRDRSQQLDDSDIYYYSYDMDQRQNSLYMQWKSQQLVSSTEYRAMSTHSKFHDIPSNSVVNTGIAEVKSNWSAQEIPDSVAISEAEALMTKWGVSFSTPRF